MESLTPGQAFVQSAQASGLNVPESVGNKLDKLQQIPKEIFSTGIYNANNLDSLSLTGMPFESQLKLALTEHEGVVPSDCIKPNMQAFSKSKLKTDLNNKKADIIANIMQDAGMQISEKNRDYFKTLLNSDQKNSDKTQTFRSLCNNLPNISSKDRKKLKDKIEEAVGHTDKEVDRFVKHSNKIFKVDYQKDIVKGGKIREFCKNFARATNSPVYRCLSDQNISGIERLKTYDTNLTELKQRWNQKCKTTNIFAKIFKGLIGLPSFKNASATATQSFTPSENTVSYDKPEASEAGKIALNSLGVKGYNFTHQMQQYEIAKNSGNTEMQEKILPQLVLTSEFLSYVKIPENYQGEFSPIQEGEQDPTIAALLKDIESFGSADILRSLFFEASLSASF